MLVEQREVTQRVAGSGEEQHGNFHCWQVFDPQLLWFGGRMEWVREQDDSCAVGRPEASLSGEHGGHPPSHRPSRHNDVWTHSGPGPSQHRTMAFDEFGDPVWASAPPLFVRVVERCHGVALCQKSIANSLDTLVVLVGPCSVSHQYRALAICSTQACGDILTWCPFHELR
jgi:hypothetical protein